MTGRTVLHVKKNDLVQVLTGRDKGKTGKVLKVNNKHGRVIVEKLNLVKRHTKATPNKPGGIVESERGIPVGKVLLYCDKCGQGVRTRKKALESGKKVRECTQCSTQLDK